GLSDRCRHTDLLIPLREAEVGGGVHDGDRVGHLRLVPLTNFSCLPVDGLAGSSDPAAGAELAGARTAGGCEERAEERHGSRPAGAPPATAARRRDVAGPGGG